ncbi:hypothetical protein D931_01830 [Enterococcus faecium 13.SD.W.09]|nr:hypothetical protein D931_01830 [Enterococcus faecium 13.SD.W.09]
MDTFDLYDLYQDWRPNRARGSSVAPFCLPLKQDAQKSVIKLIPKYHSKS